MDKAMGTFLVGLFAFFIALLFLAHTSMYNDAMVKCLERHSRDACMETLR